MPPHSFSIYQQFRELQSKINPYRNAIYKVNKLPEKCSKGRDKDMEKCRELSNKNNPF